MRQTIAPQHAAASADISRHVAEFLARGGQIQQLPSCIEAGVRPHNERCNEYRMQMQEQIRTAEAKR